MRVPVAALRLLLDVLTEIGAGNAVSIIPIHAELTTQDAANALGVSRPHLVRLLEQGEPVPQGRHASARALPGPRGLRGPH
jgi:hypothetical protein